jgi:hypothetical protein
VAEEVSWQWEWVVAFFSCDMVPSFIHLFPFWGREADGGRGFSFPLLALTAHGVFHSFLLSLPSLVVQIRLN